MIQIDELAERLKEIGQSAVAITDHGNLYGSCEAYKLLKDAGIKCIIGCECYICDDRTIKNKESKTHHLILLVKDETGRQNLQKIVTESTKYKYRGKPRIDFTLLTQYHEGLICCSACMAGELQRALETDDNISAEAIAMKYKKLFADDYYLEYQSHAIQEQQDLNLKIVNLANKLNIKYIVTCDAHYLKREDQKYHSVFVQVGTVREAGETYNDCYVQSEQEVIEICKSTAEYNSIAIQNTQDIADKCNAEYPLSAPIIPHQSVPAQFKSEEAYLKYLCNQGYKNKGFDKLPKDIQHKYKERAKYEINAVTQMGFEGYYLLVHSYVSSAKRRGIARGSAGGSLLAYLCGIVDIDPIKFGLYFERFIDVGAIELLKNGTITRKQLKIPDVDTDFSPTDRDKVMEFIINTYGENNVVCLGQFGYMWAKGAIKDIGKVLGVPFEITNQMTKNLDKESIKDALELGLLDEYKSDYPELFEYASRLSGLPKSFGIHPCGRVICMRNADYYNALEYDESKNIWVLQGDMHTADDLGLVKIDLLGLRTLDVIYDVLDMIGKGYNYIAPHLIDMEDQAVWEEFAQGHTDLIFQFESGGMKRMLKDMGCRDIESLGAANALYRPGAMSYISNYVNRKKGQEEITYLHQDLEPILASSYGIIVYQEQLIEIGRLSGLKNPDELRQATAKKKPKLMAKIEPEFKQGLIARGWIQEQVDKLWTDILEFARYSFNKCISGDTIIQRLGIKNNVFHPTVAEMYRIKNDRDYAIATNHYDLHKKYNSYGYGNALSMFDDLKVRKNKIEDILFSGIQQTYKVVTKSGAEISCTENHKFPTSQGKKILSDLKVGDTLYVIGKYAHTDKKYNLTDGNFASNCPVKGERGFQKNPNGQSVIFETTRERHISNCDCCEICEKEYSASGSFELHHKDNNRCNNLDSNLQWCCNSCHKKEQYKLGRTKVFEKGLPVFLDEIVSISKDKTEPVYDIVMEDPAHTFISESGLVTSNSHSAAYALTAYISMFLKTHHPVEFITATINSHDGDTTKIANVISEAKRMGIKYQFNDWRNANGRTICKDNIVRLGTDTIKGCSANLANGLNSISENFNGTFLDLVIAANTNQDIGKVKLSALIKLGMFEEFGCNQKLLQIHELYQSIYQSKVFNKAKLPVDIEIIKKYARETEKQFRDIDNQGLFNELYETIENKPMPVREQIQAQLELLGYVNYTNPKLQGLYFVQDINTKYSPRITLYDLSDGELQVMKIQSKAYGNNPFSVGDVIQILYKEQRNKSQKIDGKWCKIVDEYDTWISSYKIRGDNKS